MKNIDTLDSISSEIIRAASALCLKFSRVLSGRNLVEASFQVILKNCFKI